MPTSKLDYLIRGLRGFFRRLAAPLITRGHSKGTSIPKPNIFLGRYLEIASQNHMKYLPEANIAAWRDVCHYLPDIPDGHAGLGDALRRVNRFEEAREVLVSGQARWPKDYDIAVALARVAADTGDWSDAERRWTSIRTAFPARKPSYFEGARAARLDGRIPLAESILEAAQKRFPTEIEAFSAYAYAAAARQDWECALQRWRRVTEIFEKSAEGFVGETTLLNKLGRFEAADELTQRALRRFPLNPALRAARAWTSNGRGDIAEARARWAEVREWCPKDPIGWVGEFSVLKKARMVEEFEQLTTEAATRFPKHQEILIEHARSAEVRQDWPTASARWRTVKDIFPALADINIALNSISATLSSMDCRQRADASSPP